MVPYMASAWAVDFPRPGATRTLAFELPETTQYPLRLRISWLVQLKINTKTICQIQRRLNSFPHQYVISGSSYPGKTSKSIPSHRRNESKCSITSNPPMKYTSYHQSLHPQLFSPTENLFSKIWGNPGP